MLAEFSSGEDVARGAVDAASIIAVSSSELWRTGRYQELSSRLTSELAQAEAAGHWQEFTDAANDLACVHRAQGDLETASYFQLLAATTERRKADPVAVSLSATALGNLACDALLANNLALAENLLWKSLLQELAAGNESGIAADWANLGLLAGLTGDLEAAKERLWEALKRHRLLNDQLHIGMDCWHLAQLFELERDWNFAARLYENAASHFNRIGHREKLQAAQQQARINAARSSVLTFDASRN